MNKAIKTRKTSLRLDRIQASPSMSAMKDVARMKAEGREVLSLNVGEPDFAPPPEAIEAAIAALRSGKTRYVTTNGVPELRQAICDKLRAENGLMYEIDEICVGTGAKQLIFAAMGATLDAGDEVIVPAPYWVSYPDIAKLFDADPILVACKAEDGFKLTPTALSAHLSENTRWLVLNSPGNPSGCTYSQAELSALGEVLEGNPDVLILSDEIYEHFTYGNARFVSTAEALPALKDRILTLNGVSKAFAMTGMRLGYGAGPRWLIDACAKLITQDTSCANSVSQAAAVSALGLQTDYLQFNRDAYDRRGQALARAINAIPGLSCQSPEGAFYLFVSLAEIMGKTTPDGAQIDSDAAFVKYLVTTAGVVALPGAVFGMSPYMRLSFATDEKTLERAADLIADAVRALT